MKNNVLKKLMVLGIGSMLLMGSSVSVNAYSDGHLHFDSNRDHICDYKSFVYVPDSMEWVEKQCGEYLVCEDANKDHYCDYDCGKKYGEHADTNRDHLCDYCGQFVSEHRGGTATCISKAVCDICGEEYGELNADNHINTEILPGKSPTCTEDGFAGFVHCLDCSTMYDNGITIPATGHSGGTATCCKKAVCDMCGRQYGGYNGANHAGTELWNVKRATCTEDGYTGDTYCKGCGVKLLNGNPITKLGHIDKNKDHYCDEEVCKAKLSECTGGEATCKDLAICEYCGEEYGEVDPNNHINTELRNEKEATCTEDGYTGDTYCKSCDAQLSTGTVIPATGHKNNEHLCIHTYFDKLKYECSGGTVTCWARPVCEVCGVEYGDYKCIDTFIRNGYPATCTEDGFIGEIMCGQCKQMTMGPTIPATGHSGGTATCISKAVCEVCGEEYGELNADNHVGDTEIRDAKPATCEEDGYSGDIYCKSCNNVVETGSELPRLGHIDEDTNHICDRETCGKVLSECTGGEATCKDLAVCEYCGHEYGEKDMSNHVGDTEIRDAKPTTCEEDGYTGDTYCVSCNAKLLDGEPIAKLGHIDENKDHYCDREDCKAKLSECTGGVATCKDQAICEYCSSAYGELDAANHVGDTEIRDAKPTTCEEDGYTGDTYCTSCNTKLLDGEPIAKLGHKGGVATCKDQAICDTCKNQYGELDAANHVGDTEIRDAKPATCEEDGYTGDTYCVSCNTKLLDGIVIPATGHVDNDDNNECDTCGIVISETEPETEPITEKEKPAKKKETEKQTESKPVVEETESNLPEAPKTGDNTPVVALFCLLLGSIAIIFGCITCRGRKED